MKKLFIALLLCLCVPLTSFAAGSCTVTKVSLSDIYQVLIYDWTSDASAGTVTTSDCTNCNTISVDGLIMVVELQSGSALPTTGYDVELLDAVSSGRDILMANGTAGTGANIASATTDEATQFRGPTNVDGGYVGLFGKALYPSITNAGNSKTGKIIVHVYGRVK